MPNQEEQRVHDYMKAMQDDSSAFFNATGHVHAEAAERMRDLYLRISAMGELAARRGDTTALYAAARFAGAAHAAEVLMDDALEHLSSSLKSANRNPGEVHVVYLGEINASDLFDKDKKDA